MGLPNFQKLGGGKQLRWGLNFSGGTFGVYPIEKSVIISKHAYILKIFIVGNVFSSDLDSENVKIFPFGATMVTPKVRLSLS